MRLLSQDLEGGVGVDSIDEHEHALAVLGGGGPQQLVQNGDWSAPWAQWLAGSARHA